MSQLRVAIVGAGPSGLYAADALGGKAQISLFDHLPTPGGLVRAGVAPDHPATKGVLSTFDTIARRPNVTAYLNVTVGRDVAPDELLRHHHAVLYTVGALGDRRLGIPGEDLPGSHSATEFVAWYNGHPDFTDRAFDLSRARAIVVGNGNVALDVARILVLGLDVLRQTDAADHALAALAASQVQEVVVLGRRGARQAAFTGPELLALGELPGVDVSVDQADVDAAPDLLPADSSRAARYAALVKHDILTEFAQRAPTGAAKRIVLRFLGSPLELHGDGRVESALITRNELIEGRAQATDVTEELECGLVLRSVGFRGRALDGVPFDDDRAVIPNEAGRVIGATGVYAAGWIKRGPTGVIGTNRFDALKTVDTLLADAADGRLPEPPEDGFEALIAERCPGRIDMDGWGRIDTAEMAAGAAAGRPRVKLTTREDLLGAA